MKYIQAWWQWSTGNGIVRKVVGFGAPVLVALFIIGAVSGGSSDSADTSALAESTAVDAAPTATSTAAEPATPTATEAPSEAPASATAAPSRCLPVDQAMLDNIAQGLTVTGGGSVRNGAAVKSKAFESVYMIAADLQGTGLKGSDNLAVWASNSLEPGSGIIMSVDAFAKEFSDWPDASKTSAKISPSDDGVDEAKACAKAASP